MKHAINKKESRGERVKGAKWGVNPNYLLKYQPNIPELENENEKKLEAGRLRQKIGRDREDSHVVCIPFLT